MEQINQEEFIAVCDDLVLTLKGVINSNLEQRIRDVLTEFVDMPDLYDVRNNVPITVTYNLNFDYNTIRMIVGKVRAKNDL